MRRTLAALCSAISRHAHNAALYLNGCGTKADRARRLGQFNKLAPAEQSAHLDRQMKTWRPQHHG